MAGVTTALIAAIAALVTAGVAFAGSIISKDLKTTEFRQAWINDQRRDLAIVAALALKLVGQAQSVSRARDIREFDEAIERIFLRENPTKNEWRIPLQTISQIRKWAVMPGGDPKLIRYYIEELRSSALKLLKTEWDRVRAGEKSYQRARKVMVVTGILAGALWLILLAAAAYGKGFIVIGGAPQ